MPDTGLTGFTIDQIEVGQSESIERTVTQDDIQKFAEVSGDDNPVHLDEEFAKTTMFKGIIAHGMLSAGYISAAIGTKLPGYGCIYVGQSLKFRAPVKVGDTVVTTVTVTEKNTEKSRVKLDTVCRVGDTDVITGEADVMIPR